MKPAVARLQLLQRLGVYGLLLLVFLAVSVFVRANLLAPRPVRLRLGAGSARGEAFALAQALAVIAVRHAPEIVVEVVETAGSEENFRLLERGELELAFVQVDTPSSASARLMAMLYADHAQLVARESSDIKSVADLRGRRVSLPPSGSGQWNTFWAIAEHFGLSAADITIVPQTGREAIAAIVAGEIDAIFHVQSVFHRDVSELVASTSVRFIAIDQTEALQLLRPGCRASIVPRGVYRGVPAVPLLDTPSLAVQRVLIARAGCAQSAVSKITELLFERQRELLEMTPLAVFIHQPNRGEAMVMPIHPGATAYYDREKPGFLVEYADFVGLVLSVALMLASGVVWLRSLISNQQKNKADTYAHELIDRTQVIRQCVDPKELSSEHRRLLIILAEVLDDLDHDRVNVEGFTFFSFTWNVALSELRERQVELRELAAEAAAAARSGEMLLKSAPPEAES